MLLGLESPFDKSFLGSDLVQRHQLEPLWRAPSRQGRFVPLRPAALMPAAAHRIGEVFWHETLLRYSVAI
jgi:hypothetical protein